MAINNTLEYFTFSSDDLGDFKSVILPSIYEELFLLDRFDNKSVSAIAAMVDGVPVAALIGQITGEAEAKIHSIYVSTDYRRMGIATELLNRFLSICNQELDPTFGDDNNLVAVMVSTEYSLPEDMAKAFESFLYAKGFRLFDEKADVYYFESEQLADFGKKENGVFCFTDIEGTDEKEIFDYYDSMNITAAVKYSFYAGTKDDPNIMLLVSAEDDDVYSFTSVKLSETADEAEYDKLISAAINAIKEDNKTFTIIADGERNILHTYWQSLAHKYGEIVKHTIAGLAAVFE
ncbi:MAG: GNAT family N-acetyltransferase [Clostridia bacterium]|nr:GNAT family N-acetyltransferase [Clostridia bacterium]